MLCVLLGERVWLADTVRDAVGVPEPEDVDACELDCVSLAVTEVVCV